MTKLKGRTALVTGGSRGIGAAIVKKLAEQGVSFIGIHYSSNRDAAEGVLAAIRKLGSDGMIIQADLKDGVRAADKIQSEFKAGVEQHVENPGLDILVNNAGIAPALLLEQTTEADFDSIIDVNLKSPFFLIQRFSGMLRENGRIINISTGFTRIAGPTHVAYSASKGALETMTLALSPHFGARNITINTVIPGYTRTDMTKEWFENPDAVAFASSQSVFKRVGNPEDVADVAAFLASPAARWITGQFVDATGGARL
jgi:NAD(P)-dependent dehydrogenase (short-subunit alcohol dehydrogenase family)